MTVIGSFLQPAVSFGRSASTQSDSDKPHKSFSQKVKDSFSHKDCTFCKKGPAAANQEQWDKMGKSVSDSYTRMKDKFSS